MSKTARRPTVSIVIFFIFATFFCDRMMFSAAKLRNKLECSKSFPTFNNLRAHKYIGNKKMINRMTVLFS